MRIFKNLDQDLINQIQQELGKNIWLAKRWSIRSLTIGSKYCLWCGGDGGMTRDMAFCTGLCLAAAVTDPYGLKKPCVKVIARHNAAVLLFHDRSNWPVWKQYRKFAVVPEKERVELEKK